METGLQLLMRDGAVHVTFRPRLTPEQYAEFSRILEIASTRDELCKAGKEAAARWGLEFLCDPVGV